MKLLEAVENVSLDDLSSFTSINEAIQDRLMWLEWKEPESDGSVYETWEEKYDEWSEIAELSEDILENMDDKEYDLEENIDNLKEMVDDFQIMYGGLSRLKI